MSKWRNHIEKYLRGELTPAEMHALEKEALRDPFLAEALAGAEQTSHESFLLDLAELRQSIHQRTRRKKGKIISLSNWTVGIAAGLLIIAASSVYLISLMNERRADKEMAYLDQLPEQQKDEEKTAAPVTDSVMASTGTSGESTPNEPKEQTQFKLSTKPAGPADSGDKKPVIVTDVAQTQPVDNSREKEVVADLTEWPVTYKDSIVTDPLAERSADLAAVSKSEGYLKLPEQTVRGKVTSTEDGAGIVGVNVLVKGTTVGAITNHEGLYEIALPHGKEDLIFSFIGMESTEANVTNVPELNVELKPDLSQLSEVVVTGMGTDVLARDGRTTLHLAEPIGGRQAFQRYLEEKMNYPEQARKNKIEGKVTVQFSVEPNGQLAEFKIIKGIGYGCDDEVIRLIKAGPAWSPSKRNDKPVKDKVKVRLAFKIPD